MWNVHFSDQWVDSLQVLPIDPWRKVGIEAAITYELRLEPHNAGEQAPGSNVWVRSIVGFSGEPDVVVFYVFNATDVYVGRIELA